MVLAENGDTSYRHFNAQLHKHSCQFTYQCLIVNRHVLCVSLCVIHKSSGNGISLVYVLPLSVQGKCVIETVLILTFVMTLTVCHWKCIPISISFHNHAYRIVFTDSVSLTDEHWVCITWNGPTQGTQGVCTYIYTCCCTDWVFTLATTYQLPLMAILWVIDVCIKELQWHNV